MISSLILAAAISQPVGRGATIARVVSGGNVVLGKYECYTMGAGGELESAMSLNFTLYPGGRFADSAGRRGTWSYSGGYVSLRGTALNGRRLRYTAGVPHGDNPPHLTFSQGDSCDGVG